VATPNWINNPKQYRSPNLKFEFNVDKANALLDGAGYKRGGDGIREKNGKKLKFLFQTSINAPRQKVQQIVKQAAQKAGIDIELKQVVASVFFSSDVANSDTYGKFYADMQMYQVNQGRPDPQRHLSRFVSWELSAKSNKWLGLNLTRWQSDEFDKVFKAAEFELDATKRAALLIKLNDLVCSDGYVQPLLFRPAVTGLVKSLVAPLSGWDNDMAAIHEWYRES
jgi:peptide/nickel transport system substrate-binding protein